MLPRDNYQVSVLRNRPRNQTHDSGQQAPKVLGLPRLSGERKVAVQQNPASAPLVTGQGRPATLVSKKHKLWLQAPSEVTDLGQDLETLCPRLQGGRGWWPLPPGALTWHLA